MSANTSIKEGGAPRGFGPVAGLLVQGDDGKYFLWVPEIERQLDTLSVDKNGIYQAKKLGVYGWRSVSVNVPTSGSVTGKDPETGQEVTVTTDPDTGEIVKTVVPVEIKVITPPTNPYGVYVDGQTISTDGMVVKAYDAEGNEMMTVPLGQITINPTVAVFDASTDLGIIGEASIDDPAYAGFNLPIPFSGKLGSSGELRPGVQSEYSEAGPYGVIYTTDPNGKSGVVTWYSLKPTTVHYKDTVIDYNQTPPKVLVNSEGDREVNVLDYTKKNHTPFYWGQGSHGPLDSIPAPHIGTAGLDRTKIGTILFDGTRTEQPAGSPQTITVSWPRTGDGAILETTFDILVGPRGGGGED